MADQDAPGLFPMRLVLRMLYFMGLPVISQAATAPSVLWNRMSDLPSPFRSPVPIAFQLAPGLKDSTLALMTKLAASFNFQNSTAPLLFWNTISDLPSASKSPAPTMRQFGSGAPRLAPMTLL